jgi:hypothetical protein
MNPPGDHSLYPCNAPGCTKFVDEELDPYCELCPEHLAAHEADYDPTPWCSYGHMRKSDCDCGELARND